MLRKSVAGVLVLVVVGTFVFLESAEQTITARAASQPVAGAGRPKVDLEALNVLLTKGLKVSRRNQETFVKKVLAKVASGKLPVALVYASYRYAKRRNPAIPFPFFETSLRSLAKRNRIIL